MRFCVLCLSLISVGLLTLPAVAMSVPGASASGQGLFVEVAGRRYVRERDCTPTNGPYGFYGNLWCQPANDASYLRNLGSSWPMNTPPSFRQQKRSSGSDW
jgi:hypothetical protein